MDGRAGGITRRETLAAFVATNVPLLPRSSVAASPVLLGCLAPLSSPGDQLRGAAIKWAVELAVKDVNYKGGLNGHSIEVIVKDTTGRPEEAAVSAERLILQNHVVALLSGGGDSVAFAEMAVSHKFGIPWVTMVARSDRISATAGAKSYEAFRVCPGDSMIDQVVVDWIVRKGFKKVALIAESAAQGDRSAPVLGGLLQQRRVEHVVVSLTASVQGVASTFQHLRGLSPSPDLWAIIGDGMPQRQFVLEACQNDLRPMARASVLASYSLLRELSRISRTRCLEGSWAAVDSVLLKGHRNIAAQRFLTRLRTRCSTAVIDVALDVAMECYDAVWILATGITKAGSTDPKGVIRGLESVQDYPGLRGRYSCSTSKMPLWTFHQFSGPTIDVHQFIEITDAPGNSGDPTQECLPPLP